MRSDRTRHGMPSNGTAVLLAMPLIVVPLARWCLERPLSLMRPPVPAPVH